ncbi:hypothetical protein KGY73_06860 [bacterium]|nr:hypothetical protein [bacterium]
MEKDWKKQLSEVFEEFAILENCKKETLQNFDHFCEFIAEPAFESLEEEFKDYGVKTKYKRDKGKSILFQINFPRSRVDNFQYIIYLPKNSPEMKLKLRLKGRNEKRSLKKEWEEPFLGDIEASEVLNIQQDTLIQDIIDHYRNFTLESFTQQE